MEGNKEGITIFGSCICIDRLMKNLMMTIIVHVLNILVIWAAINISEGYILILY